MADELTGALRALAGRFRRDRRGVAAVEFALVMPVLIVMYVGIVEVTNAVMANRKMSATASALGDLAAQAQNISNTDIANVFDASGSTMQPYSTGTLQMRITQVRIDILGRATVGWSDARCGSPCTLPALTAGASFAGLPAGINTPNTTVVLAEVRYSYSSALSSMFVGTIAMNDSFWLRPRMGDCVQRSGSCG